MRPEAALLLSYAGAALFTFRLEIEARLCRRFLSLDRSLNLLPLSVSGVSLRKRGHKTKGRECLSINTYWR